jgi:hypothetical protein
MIEIKPVMPKHHDSSSSAPCFSLEALLKNVKKFARGVYDDGSIMKQKHTTV